MPELANHEPVKSTAADSTATPRIASWRKRIFSLTKRRALALLAIFLLLAIGVRATLPLLVERGAAFASRYYLGLPARIDNVDFSLFNGNILLEGIRLGNAPDKVAPMRAAWDPPAIDPSTALLQIKRISVTLSWRDLLKKNLRLTEVTIDAPTLRLLREEDGGIDPLRHARPLAVPAKSKETTGKPPEKPWSVEVNQFALRTPDVLIADHSSGRNLLEFSLESFELDNVTAKGPDFALGAVGIHGPVLRVRRDLVLADSQKPAAMPAPSATAPENAAASGYRIKNVAIERARFTWVTDQGPLDVLLSLKASDISAEPGKRFPIDLALQIADGKIALAGDAGIFPPAYTGELTWNALPFPPLLLASLPELAAWLHSAESSGHLKIDTDITGAHGPPAIRFSGQSTVEALAVADPAGKEFSLGWNRLECVMSDVFVPVPDPAKALPTTRAHFDLVRLIEPEIRYTYPSPTLNALLGISNSTPGSPVAAAPPPSKSGGSEYSPVEASVARLEISGGNIEVHDTTVSPAVTSTVRDLAVTASAVHFPDPSADAISLRATLPLASLLTVEGSLKPGNAGDFTISLEQLDLPTFNSYAAAAGASLDGGQISMKMNLKTQGALTQIDSDLVLHQFALSLRNPADFTREFGMPIDLAIALMSDPAGDIRLTIPVKVDEKGTTVAVHTVVASALKAALLGAVSTPLKLLGGTFGKPSGQDGGALTIAPVKSPAGSADLAPDAPTRMAGLAKLLAERPAMGLVLRGRTSLQDQPLVAEQVLIERIKDRQGLPKVDGDGFLARHRISQILAKRGKGEAASLPAKDQALFDRYLAAAGNLDNRLDLLAKARAEKARDLLVAKGVAATRLDIGEREAAGDAGVVISFRQQPAVKGKLKSSGSAKKKNA